MAIKNSTINFPKINHNFYPRDAMPARVLAVILCLYVCLFVCLKHADIASKQLNFRSHKQRHMVARSL